MSEVYYINNNYSSQNIKVILKSNINIISNDLFYNFCSGCRQQRTMASVPQGMFAARKVRENMNNTWERSLCDARQQQRKPQPEAQEKSGSWNRPGLGRDWATHFPKLTQQLLDHPPARYNSKLMNSIWGLYNRYSVHNFKKITGDVAACFGQQQPELIMIQPGYPGVAVSFPPANVSGGVGVGGITSQGSKPTPPTWEHILGADY